MTSGDGLSVCPECHGPVDPATRQFCPRCGYPVVSSRATGPAPPPAPVTPRPPAPGDDRAGTAGDPVGDTGDHDAGAGMQRRGGALELTCPACGHANPTTRVRCARCGTAVGVVETLVELPPGPPAPEPRLGRDRWPLVVTALAVLAVVLAVAGIIVGATGDDDDEGSGNGRTDGSDDLERVPSELVKAESDNHLRRAGDLTYFACNVLDGDTATAWNSRPDRAERSILTFRFARPVELRSITMVNGYAKDAQRFRANSAVTEATVGAGTRTFTWSLDGGSTQPQTLAEEFGRVQDVGLRVEGIRPGTEHPEVAITEVWFEEALPGGEDPPGAVQQLDVSCPPASP